MNALLNRIRTAAERRIAYRRTVAELSQLQIDTALDLDIHTGDARRIAHRAVYGA